MKTAILLMSFSSVLLGQISSGFVRHTSTGATGLYRLPDLAPGVYAVTVQRAGFRTSIAPHVSFEINQEARLDLRLEIGAAHETITVAASASPLQTADSSEGYRFDSATFTQLPIDGRNVLALVTLGPGAIPRQFGGFGHDTDNDVQQGSRGSVVLNPAINGARPIFHRNQFGGSLGGPLPLPSTSFFVTYERVRSKSAKSSVQLVPDAAARSGNFLGDATIYDPLTPSGRAPNIVPGRSVSRSSSQRSVDRWFNTAGFSDPAPYTFGNAGRNIIPGPGNEVTDIALHRRFVIRERATLEIRAESFNLLNHPNYGIPGPYPDFGPLFGKILSTGDPRRLQFGSRFNF
jgi:hypothetical protein